MEAYLYKFCKHSIVLISFSNIVKHFNKKAKYQSLVFICDLEGFWIRGSPLKKNAHFLAVFLDFFRIGNLQIVEVFFALNSVRQDSSFKLSKSTLWQLFWFFTIRGDPCDFGGVKIYRHSFSRSNIENRCSFGIRPWHMVEITSVCLVTNLIALVSNQ